MQQFRSIIKNQNKGFVSIVGLVLALMIIATAIYFISGNLANNSENNKDPIDKAREAQDEIDSHSEDLENSLNQ